MKEKEVPRHWVHFPETERVFEHYQRCDGLRSVNHTVEWDISWASGGSGHKFTRGYSEQEMWKFVLKQPLKKCGCSDQKILMDEIQEALEHEQQG